MKIKSFCKSQLKVKHLMWHFSEVPKLDNANQKVMQERDFSSYIGFYFSLNSHRTNIFPASMTTFFHQLQKKEWLKQKKLQVSKSELN